MNIENIKTPQDILEFMKQNIEYGWISTTGEKHIRNMKDFRRTYKTLSIEETLKEGVGTCIEQVYLMNYLLKMINIESRMFCTRIYESNDFDNLEESEHMHCFILYNLNGKIYQIEHPNWENIGIYEFNSIEEAITSINEYYIEISEGAARPVTEFYKVEPNLSFKEFNNYINNLDEVQELKK